MIVFYYVRHGQTRFNKLMRMQGFCDSPLTEQGVEDAKKAGRALAHVSFARAYSSTSGRTRDTLELILNGRQVPTEYLKDLREFDYGDMDGMYIPDILEEIRARSLTDSFADVGGDDAQSLRQRSRRAFDRMVRDSHDEDRILVVSHGSFGRHLLKPMFGIDPDPEGRRDRKSGIWLPNGGIMKFGYDGTWHMLHLPAEPDLFVDGE